MHGVQGPGGPRWGITPGRGGSRTAGRDVYVRRRILAVLVVLLLLALLAPRACQALLGSNEDTGQREEQKAGTPETATGSGTKDTAKTETKDTPSDRGAPFVKEEAGSKDTSGAATPDLTAMIVGPAEIGGDEALAVEDAAGNGSGTDQGAQGPAGPSLAAGQQTVVEPQNAPETSRAPAQRPPSDAERAPAHRQKLFRPATPVATPARERIRDRGDRVGTVPVAVEPAAVEPAAVEPAAVEPAAPSAGADETAFVARDTFVGPRGVATNFRGNAVGGAVNGGAPFNRVVGAGNTTPAVLAGGPRRTVAGFLSTPRPAIL
jgi:hypothetical protein